MPFDWIEMFLYESRIFQFRKMNIAVVPMKLPLTEHTWLFRTQANLFILYYITIHRPRIITFKSVETTEANGERHGALWIRHSGTWRGVQHAINRKIESNSGISDTCASRFICQIFSQSAAERANTKIQSIIHSTVENVRKDYSIFFCSAIKHFSLASPLNFCVPIWTSLNEYLWCIPSRNGKFPIQFEPIAV